MSDLGDLGRLLQDESTTLADLDWLDIDEEAYREHEDLPEQNLNAIPDLEEEWGRRTEADEYGLSALREEPEKKTTPFWSERPISTGLSEQERTEIAVRFLRMQLLKGASVDEVIAHFRDHFDDSVISSSEERISSALHEEGLLGTVYVDASLFPDCDQGQGQDLVQSSAQDALYVLGKDKCLDCVHNQNGVCSKFEKEIVFEVEWSDDLWKHYRDTFESQGKDLSHIDPDDDPKSKIQQASRAGPVERTTIHDRKPVLDHHPADEVSGDEAEQTIKQADIQREIVGDVYQQRKQKQAAREMIRGHHGRPLADQLEEDPDLRDLQKHHHLLGRLYVDLSFFDSYEQFASFTREEDLDLDACLLCGVPKQHEEPHPEWTDLSRVTLQHPTMINRIVHRYGLIQWGHGYEEEHRSIVESMARRLMDRPPQEIRSFAQNVFARPVPEETRQYTHLAPVFVDPTKGISSQEALDAVQHFEPSTPDIDDPYVRRLQQDVAQRMMAGDHGDKMAARLDMDDALTPLRKHLHVLGRLYRCDGLFGDDETREAFYQNRPELEDLPAYEGASTFERDEVQRRIISRYLKLQAPLDDQVAQTLKDFMGSALKVADSATVRRFAQHVFAQSLPYKKDAYSRLYQVERNPTGDLSGEEARQHLASMDDTWEEITSSGMFESQRRRLARTMASGHHGRMMEARVQFDPVARPLESHVHLLGRLYRLPDEVMFDDARQKESFYRKHAQIRELPVWSSSESEDAFFSREEVLDRIAARCERLPGAFDRVREHLEQMDGAETRRLAQRLFAQPVLPEQETYDRLYEVHRDPTGDVSEQEARSRLRAADHQEPTIDQSSHQRALMRRLARRMMRGQHDRTLQAMIDMWEPARTKLGPHVHLLGKLYRWNDDRVFDDDEDRASFYQSHPRVQRLPIWSQGDTVASFFGQSSVLDRICDRCDKIAGSFQDVRASLQAMEPDAVRRFAQMVFAQPALHDERTYSRLYEVHRDPTGGISDDAAVGALRDADMDRATVDSSAYQRSKLRQLAQEMMRGHHGPSIQAWLQTWDPARNILQDHLHLMGRVYVDSRFFSSPDDFEAFVNRHRLHDLPDYAKIGSEVWTREDVHHRLYEQSLKVTDLVDREANRRSFGERLVSMPPSQIKSMARELFARTPRPRTASFGGPIYQTPQQRQLDEPITEEDVEAHHEQIAARQESMQLEPRIKDYLQEAGRPAAQVWAHQLGLDRLRRYYLGRDRNNVLEACRASDSHETVQQDMQSLLQAVLTEFPERTCGVTPPPSVFDTEMGTRLRDYMLDGKVGVELADQLNASHPYRQLLTHAPEIALLREEEGLYGQVYSTAESFDDCRVGAKQVPDTVQRIVKGDKCEGCRFNQHDSYCRLYERDLVDQPNYDLDDVRHHAAHYLDAGSISKTQAEQVLAQEGAPAAKLQTLARLSNHQHHPDVVASDSTLEAYRGDPNASTGSQHDVDDMIGFVQDRLEEGGYGRRLKSLIQDHYPPEVIRQGRDKLAELFEAYDVSSIDPVDHHSASAKTGIEQMEEFDLHRSNSALDDLDVHHEPNTMDESPQDFDLDQGGMDVDLEDQDSS